MPLLKLKLILNCIPVVNGAGLISGLLSSLQARASYYENITCTTATLTELEIIE
jgi:hypothetical protein